MLFCPLSLIIMIRYIIAISENDQLLNEFLSETNKHQLHQGVVDPQRATCRFNVMFSEINKSPYMTFFLCNQVDINFKSVTNLFQYFRQGSQTVRHIPFLFGQLPKLCIFVSQFTYTKEEIMTSWHWNTFPIRGHSHLWIPSTKGQLCRALMFFVMLIGTRCSLNNQVVWETHDADATSV